MHEYDITLKSVLTRHAGAFLCDLTGVAVVRWHNTELPAVRHRRADLLGETTDGRLVHIELQSTNQPWMARRMLEYSLAIHRKFRRFPEQVVLYVGNPPLRMHPGLAGPGLSFHCRIVDIREFDGESLLRSASLGDNILAILMRLSNDRSAVRRILGRIGASSSDERDPALGEFLVLSGLRRLSTVIEKEIENMPILDDIMDHEVIGRERKRGMAEGERRVILSQIDKRFGPVPDWASQKIDSLSPAELEPLGLRILDVTSLEDLLGPKP